MRNPAKVYENLLNIVIKLAEYGLVHGDFNEFNLMINDDEEVTIIDFPQMTSTSHPNA
jgi:RIO kinase 2